MIQILNHSFRIASRTEAPPAADPDQIWRDPIARRAAVFDWLWHDRALGKPKD